MKEEQWLQSADPIEVFSAVSPDAKTLRKLRLAICAWLRSSWHFLMDERSRRAVEVAERLADGAATDEEREAAHVAAGNVLGGVADVRSDREKHIVYAAWAAKIVLSSKTEVPLSWERRTQANIFRDILGNPFRPLSRIEPSLLTWNEGFIAKQAQAAYDERKLPVGALDPNRLANLAGLLAEAGCEDTELLGHLRAAGPHVRGCFAIDTILGKS